MRVKLFICILACCTLTIHGLNYGSIKTFISGYETRIKYLVKNIMEDFPEIPCWESLDIFTAYKTVSTLSYSRYTEFYNIF